MPFRSNKILDTRFSITKSVAELMWIKVNLCENIVYGAPPRLFYYQRALALAWGV
jgi:hypothetical protein